MILTLDSNERLKDAIRVVGSLYGVTLVVSPDGRSASQPTRSTSTEPKRRSTGPRRGGRTVGADTSSGKPRTAAARSAGAPSHADVVGRTLPVRYEDGPVGGSANYWIDDTAAKVLQTARFGIDGSERDHDA